MNENFPAKVTTTAYGNGWKRQNHPDFGRDEYTQGTSPKAGDWYVGPLFIGKCSAHLRPQRGLNYYNGDEWVRLHVIDKNFVAK